jgi:hypothetical protein
MLKLLQWIKDRIKHKLEHFRWKNIKSVFREHGLALVIIIVGWEIIEDIAFPILFIYLGKHVHPVFLAGAPAAWLLCLHWLVVPIAWTWWVKIKK